MTFTMIAIMSSREIVSLGLAERTLRWNTHCSL